MSPALDESQMRAPIPRPPVRHTDVELVLADAYDAAVELQRDLAASVAALAAPDGERVAWMGLALASLPGAIVAAAGPREMRRHHIDRAIRFATSIRVAIEILDASHSLGVHPVRVRSRTIGIVARLRDISHR